MYLPALSSISGPSIRSPYTYIALDDEPPPDPKKGLENWSSLIGIITAIVGNVLIALALNVQRYAHIQLHQERVRVRERARQALKNAKNGSGRVGGYGSLNGNEEQENGGGRDDDDDEDARESLPLMQSYQSGDSNWSEGRADGRKTSSTYLKSPYWWSGQILITVGEMGNFLAYGFAPASIVSPLGVVALISNCVIAPIVFKEKFRKRDFWGVVIAVGGACTVVLSASSQETKLAPHDVWDAITTTGFEIYMGVTCFLIIVLMWASPKYGNRTILIDLGLVGLFGGYTALSTKGVSSMLSSTLLGAFKTPVTYVLIVVLLATAVMQVRYVNKALQRFDSTQVIPVQFVSFTICVIVGSAVLYRDFERTTLEQACYFAGGCLLTFFGVFLITSGRPPVDEDEECLSDEEGVEETIGLAEQDTGMPQTPGPLARHDSETSRSTRRSSRVSFRDVPKNPQPPLADPGVPTLRMPTAPASKPQFGQHAEPSEAAPLLRTTSRDSTGTSPTTRNPSIQQMLLSESAVSSSELSPIYSESSSRPATPAKRNNSVPGINLLHESSPVTPRPSTSHRPHSHHFTAPLFSPSPLSSTVTGLVPATLLKQLDNNPIARRISLRRSRPSLRSSLFVPSDELDEEVLEEGPFSAEEQRSTVADALRDGCPDDGPQSPESKKGNIRGRARSLSNTIIDLFGSRKKRVDMTSETEHEDESIGSAAPGTSRQEAALSTETL